MCPQRMECALLCPQSKYFSNTTKTITQYNECSERKTKHKPVSPGTPYPIGKAGGRGVVVKTPIKASDSEKCQIKAASELFL